MITIHTKTIGESTAGCCEIIDITVKLKEQIRATLSEPSLAIPIVGGAPSLGTWQQMVLMEFDNRSRRREIIVSLLGEFQ